MPCGKEHVQKRLHQGPETGGTTQEFTELTPQSMFMRTVAFIDVSDRSMVIAHVYGRLATVALGADRQLALVVEPLVDAVFRSG